MPPLKSPPNVLALAFFLFALGSLSAQSVASEDAVGISLSEAFALYGLPDEVEAVRGAEVWQDDVVFVYKEKKLDLYIYKDRVWQVGLTTALGVKLGDRKAAVSLLLPDIEDKGSHLLYRYAGTVWPKYARFNIDASGRVSAIYVYRPDN
jgi:hypothetical protein